jgi:hypothetical protein
MLKSEWLPLRNFSAVEKARLLVRSGFESCGVQPAIVECLERTRAQLPPAEELDFESMRRIKGVAVEPLKIEAIAIPSVTHVVLELKKLPLQMSPSLMIDTLANALQYLSNTLTSDGSPVGADEIFQFFVYSLAAATLRCLPGIVTFLERFIHGSLRETKAQYLMTQLQTGFDFIDNRMMPVEPFLLFPFCRLPERLKGVVVSTENDPIIITGFAVFAFPTWSSYRTTLFPAMLRYTGEEADVATCYQFVTEEAGTLLTDAMQTIDTAPTPYGTFFQPSAELIAGEWMIKVDGGDFEQAGDLVAAMSAVVVMGDVRIPNPSTAALELEFAALNPKWKLKCQHPVDGIKRLVAEIQHGLLMMDKAAAAIVINGVFDRPTLLALKSLFSRKDDFIFTPEIAERIRRHAMAGAKRAHAGPGSTVPRSFGARRV